MKKLLLAITLLLTLKSQAQIIEKGSIIRIDKCKFKDEGGYEILYSESSYKTVASISNTKFIIRNIESSYVLNLYDENISVQDKDTIYSYYANTKKSVKLVLMRRCEGNIIVAIFSMDGNDRFTQYTIKPRKNDRNNRK